jgi:hypothetical protein
MIKLEGVEFPSKHLTCYEAVLVTALKYMGLREETPLMGTQAYFVLRDDSSVSPRFNRVEEEWERVHGLKIETLPVADEVDLRDGIKVKLGSGIPVCLPVDLYFLPHTPHYNRLHQDHYVDVFGYDDDRYYMVCPYYHFMGWVDSSLIHTGFFSPIVGRRHLAFVLELKLETLSPARVHGLVQESCQNMLGLTVPETLVGANPQRLGLSGIRTFFSYLSQRLLNEKKDLPGNTLLDLSRQVTAVGDSRYWFCKLVQTCQAHLLPPGLVDELQSRFQDVVQSWRTIGRRLGASVHGNHPEMVERAVLQLAQVYRQEEQLFSSLLGALPDWEEGRL